VTTPVPASEFVTFLQHQLPGLDSGAYQLTVGQHVNDEAGAELSGQPLSRSYTFAVKGDRFGLSNPSATVASVFPASNATGEFTTALPHVVFTAASFPWSRYPTKEQPVPPVTGEASGALGVLVGRCPPANGQRLDEEREEGDGRQQSLCPRQCAPGPGRGTAPGATTCSTWPETTNG